MLTTLQHHNDHSTTIRNRSHTNILSSNYTTAYNGCETDTPAPNNSKIATRKTRNVFLPQRKHARGPKLHLVWKSLSPGSIPTHDTFSFRFATYSDEIKRRPKWIGKLRRDDTEKKSGWGRMGLIFYWLERFACFFTKARAALKIYKKKFFICEQKLFVFHITLKIYLSS